MWEINPACPHDDVIEWKHFSCYWCFVREIHRSPVNSLHKAQWRGHLIFLWSALWINGWVNNIEADDLRRHRPHYDVIVMLTPTTVDVRTWMCNYIQSSFCYVDAITYACCNLDVVTSNHCSRCFKFHIISLYTPYVSFSFACQMVLCIWIILCNSPNTITCFLFSHLREMLSGEYINLTEIMCDLWSSYYSVDVPMTSRRPVFLEIRTKKYTR